LSFISISRIVLIGTGLGAVALMMMVAGGYAKPPRLGPAPPYPSAFTSDVTLQEQLYGINPGRLILVAPPGFAQTADSKQ
jgi:hypothetical protein